MLGGWIGRCRVFSLIALIILCGPASAQTASDARSLAQEASRLFRAGKYTEALPIAEQALSLREKTLGSEHHLVGTSLNILGLLYGAIGRFAEAEQTFKRSLAISEKAFGSSDRDVGTLLDNLANLYVKLGRYGDAEPLYRRGLAIRESAFGRDHSNVGISINNIAHLYTIQGRTVEAEPLYKRALAISEKERGPEHPDVGSSLHNLAELYRVQGRTVEAEPLYKRSLALFEKALGPEHPSVGSSLGGMAELYRVQGRNLEAEPLYKRSFRILENSVGPDHPLVATSLNNFANFYMSNERHAEALPLLGRSWAIRKTALGPNHPDLASTVNNLAATYRNLGRVEDVENLYLQAMSIFERAFSSEHYLFASAINNLAEFYFSQGRLAETEPLYERGLAVMEKILGPDHPNVATALNNLAELYRAQHRYDKAGPLLRRSLAIRQKAFGSEHPVVGHSLNNLASLDVARNDLSGAADHWRRATVLLQRRAERGLSGTAGSTVKGEAQRHSGYFVGLVKTTHRLVAEGAEALQRRAAEMFETAQWGQSSEAAASLAQMAARSAGGSPALAALARERQDLVAEWHAKDKLLIASKSELPAKRVAEREANLATRLSAIDTRLAAIDARFAQDFPDFAALASPKPITIADVKAGLHSDEALVLLLDTDARFKPLPEETFLWVVTKTDVRWVRSELGTEALTREVAALRCGLDYQGAWAVENSRCKELTGIDYTADDHYAGKPLPFDPARAHALYKGLFSEVEDLIAGKQLIVVPSGPLTQLPLHTLITKKPKAGATASDPSIAWLARTHATTVLPAVSSLKALRRNAKPSAAPEPFIGYGDPVLTGQPACGKITVPKSCPEAETTVATAALATASRATLTRSGPTSRAVPTYYRNGLADVTKVRELCPLPDTLLELSCVASSLGASPKNIVVGPQMTETAIKAAKLDRYRIVHFATHGLLAGETAAIAKAKAEPALVMSPPDTPTEADDGLLTASEIAGLKLDADWVVMSACNTAGGGAQEAEALSGLARAFFYAGARALLVSHWHVNSVAATLLTSRTFAEMRADPKLGRAEAFRRSMLALMADKSRPWAAHPSAWAPFVVVGEGASPAAAAPAR